ncbi:MAG: citryl-CoA lyase [Phycisphaeraceae bacterium]|nr:MAG: citryl-CoA lyase [Phycisphaeraceae bacterium]
MTMAELQPGTTPARPAARGESRVLDGELLVRGVPIGEFVGSVGFVEMVFLQVLGRYPDARERAMCEAYLVSLCEHGVTSPSTHGARVAASVRAPFGVCAISFISGAMGMYHFGALERAMEEIGGLVACGRGVRAFLDERLATGERVWGFGHRFHRSAESEAAGEAGRAPERFHEQADPRVRRLVAMADEIGWEGEHVLAVREIGRELFARKRVPINIDGFGAALLLDMGFAPSDAMLFVILGRLPNIARLYREEQGQAPNRFVALATREDAGFDRTTDREFDGGSRP